MRWICAVLVGGAALTAAASPHAGILAFNRIEHGAWQLRALDGGAQPQRICVQDPYELIQLRHPGAACSRFVLANDAQTATVHYTCTGAGYGRTTIKVETPQLMRIDSQGLANQAPFQVAFEARRLGPCGAQQAVR
ncbi:hypothetical protein HJG53_02925 [Sphingomonas sp. ID1715]|uniref:DUF3617 domain-containing protein n=1 Tax=Sphingomonas sp. ID1715 TaxID=1656898 RepID=UPI001489856F|nr:hypothetical protein [Sphingomonas sp. ID1715]NNM75859.1 hypothetical protein [Sphingomonas sp. ID1715]